jgi:hypothetical protein
MKCNIGFLTIELQDTLGVEYLFPLRLIVKQSKAAATTAIEHLESI